MNTWTDEPQQPKPRQRSLAADLMSLGPASTPGREFLAAILQIGAVALLVFVIFPDRLPELQRWGLLAATAMYFVIRVAAGLPKWRCRR
ncbi:hypothetical protein C5N14_31055 [Micromonospora sp. MW-13]|uniref:hypothetical protein n=1 Tax=unclassified Micromonospora TaxID=2617518 RepID=UPI000E4395DE|nr:MULTISPECIES: hypothetical protein [unclassified Micromonospora]MCX4471451.1 hypothetical protein [Micromonospora sp. NBC_01655]RGC64981.1 hypothetical protein C5N14_31055 [Micromonospora sp. MW-13]